VRLALVLSATAAGLARAQDGAAPAVAFTGAHIRRADGDAAANGISIERAAIVRSGKLTLGELLQELPAIGGTLTNPRVNIGGGTGVATLSLHALGAARTLLLVDGERVLSDDVNAIPAAAVERIEVLREGAAAAYGSDAVAGVVNVILRRDYQGAEFTAQSGISDRGDGRRRGYQFVFGQHTERGSILAGVDYNQFDAVLASSRAFSRNALYFYYGAGHALTSSKTPTGQVQLPPNLAAVFGCQRVTLRQLGLSGSALGDYKCYTPADGYNFQGNGNVDLTPQERSNAFLTGSYRLSDEVQTHLALYHDKTNAAAWLPPQAFDTLLGRLAISADSYYNPFGVDLGNIGYRFKTRTIGNGNRVSTNSTQNDQLSAGFDGGFGDDWHWNLRFDYGHSARLAHTSGYVDPIKLGAAVGPSYLDASGHVVCGTPASGPIADCTPVNLFDIVDPATIAALALTSNDTFTNVIGLQRSVAADVEGSLIELPAGALRLAAGLEHRKQSLRTVRDATAVADVNGNCDAGSGCVPSLDGAYSVREAYVEAFVPLLKDLAFARALNLTIAERASDYSSFGSTNNARVSLEWRPQDELLLRAAAAQVFRAPSITELYRGAQLDFPIYADPCFGVTTPNAACQYLPPGGLRTYPFPTVIAPAQQSGARIAGTPIGAEHGKTFNYGLHYAPSVLAGLSVDVDIWRVHIDDALRLVNAQQVLSSCFFHNGGPYCAAIHRFPSGPAQGFLDYVAEPFGNLGRIDAHGADLSTHYALPETRAGSFAIDLQTSYLGRLADDALPGLPSDLVRQYAGHYTTSASPVPNANFTRWRALVTLDWNRGPWHAAWTTRYVGKFTVGYSNPNYNESACQSFSPAGCELKFGATVYHNLNAGYALERFNARIDLGIDNVFDKQPPVLFLNNAPNGNTDVNAFDTVGRLYWARLSLKF